MILIFISIAATIAFGIIAIVFSVKEEQAIKKVVENEKKQKQRLIETTILKDIQDRIGYSLDVEKVMEIITGSVDNLFPYSTVSTIIPQSDKFIFKVHVKEPVSRNFLEAVKASMQKSYQALQGASAPRYMEEHISGVTLDEANHSGLASYFHVPLLISGNTVAILSVASVQPQFYKEEEMLMLYKIVDLASQALSRLENILSIEKGKLTGMITSLADGLFMVDTNGQIPVMNKAAKELLNIQKDNPTTIDVLSALPNTYDFSGKLQKAINHKRVIEEKEVQIDSKIFQLFITPVFDVSVTTEKKVIGVSVVFHDITLEQSLAKLKEDFTNVMVHELRSPLTAIKASTDLLINPPAELSEEEKKKIIVLISDQSRKMLNEVSLILDAAKLEAGLFTINRMHGDLKKIITNKVAVFSPQAHEKFITLTAEVDPSLPEFSFDTMRIEQVVSNLISNSLKFTPSGGKIRITAKPAIGSVVVSVSDTGVGIPKEKQHLLFSKFSQISTPTSAVGTGLGLYTVKGIVEAHDGSITLESEEGRGTTITFTLPMEMASKSTTESTLPKPQLQQAAN